ncbi:hypothetical protein BC829DRAFT_489352 [Chytridium lagenaria]|nr:hypothetical protein BC829DRAFT_489352 [Chytridium lagenaria]
MANWDREPCVPDEELWVENDLGAYKGAGPSVEIGPTLEVVFEVLPKGTIPAVETPTEELISTPTPNKEWITPVTTPSFNGWTTSLTDQYTLTIVLSYPATTHTIAQSIPTFLPTSTKIYEMTSLQPSPSPAPGKETATPTTIQSDFFFHQSVALEHAYQSCNSLLTQNSQTSPAPFFHNAFADPVSTAPHPHVVPVFASKIVFCNTTLLDTVTDSCVNINFPGVTHVFGYYLNIDGSVIIPRPSPELLGKTLGYCKAAVVNAAEVLEEGLWMGVLGVWVVSWMMGRLGLK